jgi:PGF-CTERM protein
MFTVGDPGSGKSFGAKQNFIRTIEQDPDCIGVVLEPLNNWNGVIEALGGERITVGGTMGLNPLEIKPTPTPDQGEPTESPTDEPTPTRTQTDSGLDGFGLLVTIVALAGAALLASRQRD